MKTPLSLLVLFTISIGLCASNISKPSSSSTNIWAIIENKANWFKEGLTGYDNLEIMPADFRKFYKSFISDSLYQVQHIHFDSLIGVISECDTTIHLNKSNWRFETWDFTEHFNNQHDEENTDDWENLIFFNDKKFFYEFHLIDAGIIYQTGFEKINGTWQLSLMYTNSC